MTDDEFTAAVERLEGDRSGQFGVKVAREAIRRLKDAESVARCWQVMVKDGGLGMDAFESGTDLRDWKLLKLGQDPERFMEEWLTKESKSTAKSRQESLLK